MRVAALIWIGWCGLLSACGSKGGTGPGTTLNGDAMVASQSDADNLKSYSEITGDLVIAAAGVTDLAFPNLARVGGSIVLDNNVSDSIQTLAFPALTTVGKTLNLGVTDQTASNSESITLQSADLTSLQTIGDSLEYNGQALAQANFPKLTTVGGRATVSVTNGVSFPVLQQVAAGIFTIANATAQATLSPSDQTLDLPSLQIVGFDFSITGDFAQINVPALQSVGGSLLLDQIADLTTFSAPALTSLSAVATQQMEAQMDTAGALDVSNDPALTTFSAPQLAGMIWTLHVASDDALTSFNANAVSALYRIDVTDNPVLSTVSVNALSTLLPSSSSLSLVRFLNNPALSTCFCQNLATKLNDSLGAVIQGDLNDTPCM